MKKVLASALVCACLLPVACTRQKYYQIGGFAQGVTWSIKYNATGVKMRPDAVQRGVEAILEDVDTTLSGYNAGSQISRLNRGDTITPSAMLSGIYARACKYWQETDGALDVAGGPVFDIWGFGFKSDSLPSEDLINEALARSGTGRLKASFEEALLPDGRLCAADLLKDSPYEVPVGSKTGGKSRNTPRTPGKPASALQKQAVASTSSEEKPGPVLNFNAIAQGYTCDTVAAFLSGIGVKDMLVDIGEILCLGSNPEGKPWKIGIDSPKDGSDALGASIEGIWKSPSDGSRRGIVTSGNYRKFYIKNGRKYAHTIDPRSGRPAENSLLSATVVAPAAEAADAYATFCMVIGLQKAREFILSRPDIEGYLIYSEEDGSTGEWHSEGFELQ